MNNAERLGGRMLAETSGVGLDEVSDQIMSRFATFELSLFYQSTN
jgi:hypothetical protein